MSYALSHADHKTLLDALIHAYGHRIGVFSRRYATVDLLQPSERADVEALCRALSVVLRASELHGRGAYARCGFCGRYSVDVFANPKISLRSVAVCECGVSSAWSASFPKPGPNAQWSISFVRVDREPKQQEQHG